MEGFNARDGGIRRRERDMKNIEEIIMDLSGAGGGGNFSDQNVVHCGKQPPSHCTVNLNFVTSN
jgi:hypothetical protein